MNKKEQSTLERKVTNTPRVAGVRPSRRLVYSTRRGIVDPHFKSLFRYMTVYYSIRESDYSAEEN